MTGEAAFTHTEIQTVPELVINYHVTEACNYGCNYCYARWNKGTQRELHCDLEKVDRLFSSLKDFFSPGNDKNPLSNYLSWKNIRINFAGGEPFLIGRRFHELIDLADRYGFKISIITNGSLITDEFIETSGSKISMLGLSIDSVTDGVLTQIGRCNKRGETLDLYNLSRQVGLLRNVNTGVKIKVNTVVNALNAHEDMGSMINLISPDKWKALQVLPVLCDDLAVSDALFNQYIARHQSYDDILVLEDNTAMTDSYIMINPEGRFYQNTGSIGDAQQQYSYSKPILIVGAGMAFSEINFNAERFAERY